MGDEETRHCPKCWGTKPISEFFPSISDTDELEEHCKLCTMRMAQAEDQKRRKRAYMRKYYHENREQILEQNREYYRKNRDMRLDYQKDYEKSEEGKEIHKKARQRRKERKGDEKNYSRREIVERDSDENGQPICQICGYPVSYENLHIDHIVPIHKGGKDVKENVRVTHGTCNVRRRKGTDNDGTE